MFNRKSKNMIYYIYYDPMDNVKDNLILIITKNAIDNGWKVKVIKNHKIELTRKWNKYDNYENIFNNLINPSPLITAR